MKRNAEEQEIFFEEAGIKFTVLNNDPRNANKVIERIKSFPNPGEEVPKGGFSLLEVLTGITLPEGVKIIDDDALNGCISLKQVNMPSTVNKMGKRALAGCDKLERIQIPESTLEKIGGAINLYENANLNRNVRINILNMPIIGDKAFRNRKDVTGVTIPEGVTKIDVEAFAGCSNLKQATMPESLTEIEVGAFNDCSSLSQINIPSNVKKIGALAFNACSNLKKANIPNGVTSIDNGVFCNCSSLTQVNIPSSVTSIGNRAFHNCSNLKKIFIPDGVTIIGFDAFSDCSSLEEVTIPNSVTKIGAVAFSDCSNLRKINIPAQLFHKEFGGNVNNVRKDLGLKSNVEIIVYENELNFDKKGVFDKINDAKNAKEKPSQTKESR